MLQNANFIGGRRQYLFSGASNHKKAANDIFNTMHEIERGSITKVCM